MEIKNRKACVIFENHEKKILLQRRDKEPDIDKWVPFGGSVEHGESDKEVAVREILEELNYKVKDIIFLKEYVRNGVKEIIYIAKDKVEIEELELHEGFEMKFFSPAELETIEIGFNYREVLKEYLEWREK